MYVAGIAEVACCTMTGAGAPAVGGLPCACTPAQVPNNNSTAPKPTAGFDKKWRMDRLTL
ncbi:MAG: hypothetical protein DWQ37_20405 [Planctomycetota bacterium]|nr:MAG: hypothetical protein DWQ37_20405 [Planctomycetota bacterium]